MSSDFSVIAESVEARIKSPHKTGGTQCWGTLCLVLIAYNGKLCKKERFPNLPSDPMAQSEEYRLSFTSGGLLLQESTRIATLHSQTGDWSRTRECAVADNLLQARSPSSSVRRVGEVCARLRMLTERQLALFQEPMQVDQLLLLWLAVCKRYAILREFADEVVRSHFLSLQLVLSREEFDRFLEKKSVWHPKIEGLADSTRAKLARAAYQMLSEAGLISQELVIQPVLLSRELARAIVADDIELLHVYPIADADVPGAGR